MAQLLRLYVRVKTVGKISGNSGFIFPYFSVILYYSANTIIGTKTGYGGAGIGRNTVGLVYRSFLDWAGKSDNFSDLSRISHTVYLGFPALFIWDFPHCSSRLDLLSFFF
jgi:hypothetical protein